MRADPDAHDAASELSARRSADAPASASIAGESPIRFQPFRRFPARTAMQRRIGSDLEACRHCLAGSCCSTEDPIGLTAFDVLRLSAFLDLPPGAFLERFTQDRFEEDGNPEHRAALLEHPESSVVSWLRRRANSTFSPCIFLKYVRETDGTPRRVCSVHPARPLACREYYHDTCRTRWTGEIAVIHAHGYEQIRDGAITPALVHSQQALVAQRLKENPDSAPDLLARSFWTEMDRALNAEACNEDGSAGYDLREWQDPLALKLNRLLSRRNLRLEERYGAVPWGDQLQPYDAGIGLAGSAERERLLRIAGSPPETRFFTGAEYPLFIAHRDWMDASPAPGFPVLSERALRNLIREVSTDPIWATHRIPAVRRMTHADVALAIVRGVNFLARFSAYVKTLDGVLEREHAGRLEAWILAGCRLIAKHSRLPASHPAFGQIMEWTASRLGRSAELRAALRRLRSIGAPRPAAVWRWVRTQEADGGWGTRPSGPGMPQVQGQYLQQIVWLSLCGLDQLTRCAQ